MRTPTRPSTSESSTSDRATARSPGKSTLTSRVPLQRKDGGAPVAAPGAGTAEGSYLVAHEPHEIASHGAAGGGGPLPFGETIQRAFGAHDVGGIRAHQGGAASEAAAALSARAYAFGDDVVFGGAPDLRTAAHEAAHVVQQRAGQVHGDGVAGDAHEQHADAVADRVVRGESATALLDGLAPAGGAAAVQCDLGADLAAGARALGARVLDWGADQIRTGAQLLEYLGGVQEDVARTMIRQLAGINAELLATFVVQHPAHQLAEYIVAQLPLERLVDVAARVNAAGRAIVLVGVRACGQIAQFFTDLHRRNRAAAIALVRELETVHLPNVLAGCAELAHDLFYEWWPAHTGFEGQVTLGAGAKVPVWPEPPIFISGSGQFQGEIKLSNAGDTGAPELEFEVGAEQEAELGAALAVPEIAEVGGSRALTLASKIKTTTRFAEIDWNVGLIEALRGRDRQAAFASLCRGLGNVAAATQFQVTLAATAAQGAEVSAGLGDVAEASLSALMSLGFEVEVLTPNPQHAGQIQAQGTFTAAISGELEANLPGVPANLSTVVEYLCRNASVGAGAEAQIGGRVVFAIPPAASLDALQTPTFDYVELFAGAQVSGHVAREELQMGAEGTVRFTRASIEAFRVPELSDGMTRAEMIAALPFSQLELKGTVAIDSGLAGLALRRLVAGDNAAIDFLTGQPSVGGQVDIKYLFTPERIADFLVGLGALGGDTGGAAQGPLRDAFAAVGAGNVRGFLTAVRAAGGNVLRFLGECFDGVDLELHADASYSVPGLESERRDERMGQDQTVSGTVEGRLRATYTRELTRDQLAEGFEQVRVFAARAMPELVS